MLSGSMDVSQVERLELYPRNRSQRLHLLGKGGAYVHQLAFSFPTCIYLTQASKPIGPCCPQEGRPLSPLSHTSLLCECPHRHTQKSVLLIKTSLGSHKLAIKINHHRWL